MAVDNTKYTDLTHHLKMISEMAGPASVAAYVIRNGRRFESAEPTDEEMEYVKHIQWNQRPPKQCYWNAQMEAMILPVVPGMDLKYVEGFVDPDVGFGLDHAWLSVNGKIVDVTLRIGDTDDRVVGHIPEDWEYIGVEMDPKVCFHVIEHQAAVPIIDDTLCGRPMIRKDLEARGINQPNQKPLRPDAVQEPNQLQKNSPTKHPETETTPTEDRPADP